MHKLTFVCFSIHTDDYLARALIH